MPKVTLTLEVTVDVASDGDEWMRKEARRQIEAGDFIPNYSTLDITDVQPIEGDFVHV